jgi:hypothetical protein
MEAGMSTADCSVFQTFNHLQRRCCIDATQPLDVLSYIAATPDSLHTHDVALGARKKLARAVSTPAGLRMITVSAH